MISISNFIKKLYSCSSYCYYLNDKLVDLCDIQNNSSELIGFQFEDSMVIRLYTDED